MNLFDIFLLALALSLDAFILSFSYGLVLHPHKLKNGLKLGASTGFFQFAMPLIGWVAAKSVNQYIEFLDHWIVFFVFLALGINVLSSALEKGQNDKPQKLENKLSFKVLLMIGIATSIDALVTGATIFFMKTPIIFSSIIIGITTFCCAFIGYGLCRIFKNLSTKYMEFVAGIILIALGCKVLFEHLSA